MADLNFAEGIHYLVTRPVVPIVDDGQGNFNISPIGFPVRNVSGERNQNPTRITPDFVMGYNNVVDGSSRLVVDYTEYNANIPSLSGLYTFIIGVTSITRIGSTVTVTTSADHGYVTGKTITIAGALQTDYNGSYTITVTASNEFTYTIATTPVTPATGSITSRYTAEENGLVYLTSQTNPDQNGYYVTRSIVWADLYLASTSNKDIRVKTNSNIDISTGGLSTVTYNIESIESVTLGTGKVFAVVTTTDENGFATGNSITIAGATVTGYNGTFDIEKLTGSSFRYEIPSALASDATGTAVYDILENDLVYAAAQTDGDENALYIAHSASSWELYGFFYEWDGTENDNVAGEYGDDVDVDGYPLNHYRKGYSLEETADFLKEKLEVQLEFGQFKGSQHNRSDHGAFVRWLLSGRQVNIGHSGKDKNVFIDGFGLGNPESAKASDRTNGTVDPYDDDAVTAKKALIAQENKYTIWGLTNHHSNSLTGYFNKSPYLKDYPRIYNSEYETESPFGYLTGGHLPVDTDVERWRMTVTGTATSTDSEVRPIMIDTLWYHRDNAYHNNITLDMKNSAMVGRHSLSIVNNFNVPDRIALIGQALADTDITAGSPGTITVPEVSPWYEGDYVQFRVEDGNTLPSGLAEYTTYKVAPGYPSGSDIQLTDLSGTPINLSDTGSGNFIIERHVFDPYNNDEVIDSLDDIAGITLNSGLSIVYPVTVGTVTNYYINPRKKGSLTDIVPKGSWTPSSLSWDAAGLNGINIYLNAAETDYVTFTHPTMLTADLLEELNQHNDMIPVPFDPVNTDIDSLTSIFVDNSLIDYTDNINRSNKIRSKKTFVHLPAPIELHDGAKIELDVSLPVIPETDSFPFNTLGSLSGYRNYVTQPRVYVLGGYQAFACENFTISSLTQTGGLATMVLASDHGRYTSTFTDSDVDVDLDSIRISNWKDVSVGDIVRFKNTAGALPTPLAIATDYIVTSIVRDTITLSDDIGVAIDITSAAAGGTHSIVIQSPIRFSLRESTDSYYNDEFDGYVYDFDTIQFNVDENAASPAPGPIILDRTITTSGANDVRGLTERSNASVFSPMPEVEFAEDGNVYNQTFTPDNLVGNGLVGDDRDIRTLLATVYPTATSTFAWRMDNSPRIRMLKWSLMNVHALGGVADTGSFANVAYKRNKEIVNEFAFLFKNGSDGVMSVYDNPLSYVDTTEPSYTQQEVNAFVRIRYQSTLAPRVLTDLLSEEDVATVGSFNYQAADAYNELLSDFYKGRVLVNSNNGNLNEYDASLPINHSGVTDIPSSFFDHTASSKFLDFTSIEGMYSGADYEAYARWYAKNIYAPRYIVNAQGYTALDAYDAYKNVDQTLKDDINDYYYDTNDRDSSANNRYVVDHLEPLIDAEFEFGAGSDNKLVNYLISNEASDLNLNDLRRRLWDSHFNIPDASDRQIQNAFHMSVTSPSIEDSAKFYGASWIPFAKIFSSDNVSPSENAIDDILDYATIIGGTYPAHNNTLDNAIASNLIAERYKELGYVDAFASVNTEDTTNSDREEFLRNYVSGYANRLPYRLYNGFKIAVAGRDDSDAYATDTSNILVDTEIDIERIYTYSTKDYLNGYITTPSADVARYLNDNFVISELSGATSEIPLYDLIESGYTPSDPSAVLYLWNWPSLTGWTRQTNTYWDSVGYAVVDDGKLVLDSGTNPMYRYDQTIPSNFVTESYIYTSDDQLMSFITHHSTAADVNFNTVINSAYATLAFEDAPLGTWPNPVANGIYLHYRKDSAPIDMSTAASKLNDFTAMDTVRVGTYVPNRLYRVLFARMSNNDFMVQVYDTTDNSLTGSVSVNVLFPNVLGETEDSMDFVLSVGRQHGWPNPGYFDKQSYAEGITDTELLALFGIADTNVYAHDLNPSWWYFENGNPSSDPENSKIKDMINVSGMNHIADREFYINKMKYNYTRVKMSFMFSKKLGRWLPLDYRQAPTSYLTPTFGATALKQTERSIISAGSTGKSVTDYINYLQPDVSNVFSASQYGGNKLNCVMLTPFSVGDTIAIYDKDSVNSITAVIASVSTSALPHTSSLLCFYTLTEDLPEIYQLQSKLNISAPINTIDSAQYPINLLTGIESRDYLWKNPICLDPANMYKQLNLIAYWEMQPMILNRACYPFLSTEFPYNNDGELVPELDHTYDPASAENYRFTRLIEPNLASPDGINFVVPNNVHGGTIDPDNSLMLYQPHMWKVYWHMRPSVCAMEGTDIPSPTERTGGVMADPVLNSIYCFPDARDPQYTIPWHDDMGRDWLNSGWLLIDARIDDVDTNPERDLYFGIDAQIVEPDEERDDFWEIESADIPAAERQAAIDDLE